MSEPLKYDPAIKRLDKDQLLKALLDWMIHQAGHPMTLDLKARNQWYRDEGMIAHFIRSQFPKDSD